MRWSPGAGADAGVINDAHGKGFKILLSVLGSPGDISGGANYGDYARFVGDLAGSGADGIEIWNEMNLDREWPAGQIDPNAYTQLLRQSYQSIKAATRARWSSPARCRPPGPRAPLGLDHVWNDDRYWPGWRRRARPTTPTALACTTTRASSARCKTAATRADDYYTRYYSPHGRHLLQRLWRRAAAVLHRAGLPDAPRDDGRCPARLAGRATPPWRSRPSGWARSRAWRATAAWCAWSIVFNVDFTGYGDDPQGGYAMIRPGGGCPACDALHAVTGGR